MATETDRLTVVEAKLDGFIEETRSRFNDMNANTNSRFNDMNSRFTSLENRMNIQFQITIAMIVTVMVAVLGTLATILVKL
ncbi:MAG: hypothetical protein IIC22_04970 [Chloroflexi bacterium]|nr:hypothetical protein [Chloroflexota bacterium]